MSVSLCLLHRRALAGVEIPAGLEKVIQGLRPHEFELGALATLVDFRREVADA